MFPFLLLPLALALGISAHDAPTASTSPATNAVVDSTKSVNTPVTVRFRNDAMDLAIVYAVADAGLPVRLGEVTPGATAKFTLPRSIVGTSAMIQLVARPFAHRYVVGSGPVGVSAGDVIDANLSSQANAIWVLPGR